MTDTVLRSAARSVLALVALASAVSPGEAWADVPRHRVLWVHNERVYVALAEGSHVEEGDSVRFDDRKKRLADGTVASVVHDEIAVVTVPPRSFERVRKLHRVRVEFLGPPLAKPATLRIALPSSGRNNLLVRCARVLPAPPSTAPVYRSENLSQRLVRWTSDAAPAPWPDTLFLHLFDDSADEEIALERGDVEIAIFWPGELSERIRRDPRWKGFPLGVRARGVLALVGASGVADADTAATGNEFNQSFFRGDLLALERDPPPPSSPHDPGPPFLFEADPAIAGRAAIEPWLARYNQPRVAQRALLPRARVTFLDAPGDTAAADGFVPIYRLRCPVVTAASLRPLVNALGAGVLADVTSCAAVAPR